MNWTELIGKKIAAFRGVPQRQHDFKGKKIPENPKTELTFILFDDEKTFIEFNEQDQYDYHDCNSSARTIHLWEDAAAWKRMMDKEGFEEPTTLAYPF